MTDEGLKTDDKQIEIIKYGVDCKEMRFTHTCAICECEYKFCLDAVIVTRFGTEKTKFTISCPRCKNYCNVVVGKFESLLKKREKFTEDNSD